jgi:hypothetical protein
VGGRLDWSKLEAKKGKRWGGRLLHDKENACQTFSLT